MSAQKPHFTAVIKVTRTTYETADQSFARRTAATPAPTERKEVVEIASIVVRSDTLEGLVRKTKGHLDLVDEAGGDRA